MYLWRKTTSSVWLDAHEETLQARFGERLAVISRPDRKRPVIQIPSPSRSEARKLIKEFGGAAEKLPRDWLKRFAGAAKDKPLRVGKRLIVVSRSGGFPAAGKNQALKKAPLLVIPAGAAFGTGDHPTTAMSLRFLEELTRRIKPKSVVDLGTGSGILALAARCFGAHRVLAIDLDPTAISTAKENARLNKIRQVDFQVNDLRRWKPRHNTDIVTANLYCELLIEILPKLKPARWFIFSGILGKQEEQFRHALDHHEIDLVEVRRRGKWIALLAKNI